jgi:hypothetical protein
MAQPLKNSLHFTEMEHPVCNMQCEAAATVATVATVAKHDNANFLGRHIHRFQIMLYILHSYFCFAQ